ncbi:hypothetical protein HanIR_Chr17g0881141 [Helianthus annuus]|nr:hypothetical protein HanIR_Chr17g0881141 [Helianthus annuus]
MARCEGGYLSIYLSIYVQLTISRFQNTGVGDPISNFQTHTNIPVPEQHSNHRQEHLTRRETDQWPL